MVDRRGVEERLAAHRGPTRFDDVVVGAGLEHIPGGAGLQRFEEELLVVVHREHQEAQLGPAVRELPRGLKTGHARHAMSRIARSTDVLRERALHRLGAVGGFGDDLEVGLGVDHVLEPLTHERVVVGDRIRVTIGIGIAQLVPVETSSRTSTPPWARA